MHHDDPEQSGVRRRRSTQHDQRVRFSLDNPTPSQTSEDTTRKSDGLVALDMDKSEQRTTPSALSLDPSLNPAATVDAPPVASTPSRSTPPTSVLHHKVSPMSSAARQRGYSLRSALFHRNMRHSPVDTSMSGIELAEATSSTHTQPLSPNSTHLPNSKKSMSSVVELSSITDEDSEDDRKLPYYQDTPGVHGIVALPDHDSRHPIWRNIKQSYSRARKFLLRIQDIPPTEHGRHIDLDPFREETLIDERTGKIYIPNTIRSSRYNAWSFVPRQLFAQFSKLANFYFLCVSILQMIPGLSTTGSTFCFLNSA